LISQAPPVRRFFVGVARACDAPTGGDIPARRDFMNRNSLFSWVVTCAGGCVLAACVAIPWPLPDTFEPVAAVSEVLDRIATSYVTKVDERKLTEAALSALTGGLDRWSAFIPPDEYQSFDEQTEGRFGGIGIFYAAHADGLLLREVLVGSPAWRADIRKGDILLRADGVALAGSDEEAIKRIIRGKAGTMLALTYRNAAATERTVTVMREIIHDPSIHRVRLLCENPAIGLVRIERFQRNTAREFAKALDALCAAKIEALVIDLRENPGGLYDEAVALAEFFLSSGVVVSTVGREPGDEHFQFVETPSPYPPLRIACLVGPRTASAAEIVSGALRDHGKAVLVGARTYGKCSVQSIYELFGNGDVYGALKLTTKHYLTPSGYSFSEGGLPADVEAPQDEKTMRALTKAWQDELLTHWNEPAALRRDPVDLDADAGLKAALELLKDPMRYTAIIDARAEKQ
jgi:carboxyl-terminal processing protease